MTLFKRKELLSESLIHLLNKVQRFSPKLLRTAARSTVLPRQFLLKGMIGNPRPSPTRSVRPQHPSPALRPIGQGRSFRSASLPPRRSHSPRPMPTAPPDGGRVFNASVRSHEQRIDGLPTRRRTGWNFAPRRHPPNDRAQVSITIIHQKKIESSKQ